jgi:hypothetical protein
MITLMSSHSRWDHYDVTIMIMVIVKQRIFKCIECANKEDKLYDVPTCCMKILTYNLFLH